MNEGLLIPVGMLIMAFLYLTICWVLELRRQKDIEKGADKPKPIYVRRDYYDR